MRECKKRKISSLVSITATSIITSGENQTDAAAILATHPAQVVDTPDHIAKHLLLFRCKLRN
jgi:hypothetical protein